MRALILAISLVSVAATATPASAQVTWGDFLASTPMHGIPITVSLGGGTTVDVLVTTGGTQGIGAADYGTGGSPETGLDYSRFIVFAIFNGGGSGTVATQITFSDFQTGSGHLRGFVSVGRVNGASSPITVTSSVSGAVQGWPQVGSAFTLDGDSSPIAWQPAAGQFITDSPVGIDSQTLVVDCGDLSQYDSITMNLNQHLNDGIIFSLGEESEVASSVPDRAETTWGAIKDLYR